MSYLDPKIEQHLLQCVVKSVRLMIGPLNFYMSDHTFLSIDKDHYQISNHFSDFIGKRLVNISYNSDFIRFTFDGGLYVDALKEGLPYLFVRWNNHEWDLSL